MWISKEDYKILQDKAEKLEDIKIEFESAIDIHRETTAIAKAKCNKLSKELYDVKKDLEYYLNTNEEKGVIYIPKFVVEKIVYDK